MKLEQDIELRVREEDYINLNPLQSGGRTYPETRKAITSYVDGYSVCDWCSGALNCIRKPPIQSFLEDVASFLGMDSALLTNGCREAKYAVMHSLASSKDFVVVDGNAHYSTFVAAERAGLRVEQLDSTGEPEYLVDPEAFGDKIREIKKIHGKTPKLAVLTHVDGSYGNLVDAEKAASACHREGVPLLLNTAYSSGRMRVDGSRLGVDFIAASCHKSWAAGGGNIGLLAANGEWAEKVFRNSSDYEIKPLEILGCSTRGAAAVALLASYPKVKERVGKWGGEVDKARRLMAGLEELGVRQLGEKPTNHDLNFLQSDVLYEISQTHKKKNYYLYSELKKRGIIGIKPGLTRHFKISTYGKTEKQCDHILWAFRDIIEKHGP
ncbi:MAG: O-phospho-L-seryl-tRNA:Cys-tRNA synthase [Candidatus Altiarchaeales archaeon]|nr:O-phospho-L-seryl-tRNA:Cys-tRNA synthase [Candidatus Altiarchaeales archaeon]